MRHVFSDDCRTAYIFPSLTWLHKNFRTQIADCNIALRVYRAIDAKDADWKNHPNNFNPNDFTPQLHPLNNLIGLMGMINLAQGNTTEAVQQFNYNISKITLANSMASIGALPISFTREMIMVKCYAYYKQGKYDEAIELYNNVIANEQYITIKGSSVSTQIQNELDFSPKFFDIKLPEKIYQLQTRSEYLQCHVVKFFWKFQAHDRLRTP